MYSCAEPASWSNNGNAAAPFALIIDDKAEEVRVWRGSRRASQPRALTTAVLVCVCVWWGCQVWTPPFVPMVHKVDKFEGGQNDSTIPALAEQLPKLHAEVMR